MQVSYFYMEIAERSSLLLKELISIRSVSGQEKRIQEFIESRLKTLGLRTIRQVVSKSRFNLFYLSDSPYVVSCHVDTVPPAGMKNPYRAVEKNGRIYGRGASDVKGALASLLTAVEVFIGGGKKLPVSLAFVVDEETNTALGSEKAVEVLGPGRKCLVLEPTYGKLCIAQQGSLEFTLKVQGKGAHASEFEKVENPIRVLLKVVDQIEKTIARRVNLIMVKGGSKVYTVPKLCSALLEVKVYEGESWEEIENKILKTIKSIKTECSVIYNREDVENFIRFKQGDLLNILSEAFRETTGIEPELGVMPSWTDAANYHKAGYECVVFGYGSLKDSHTDRESISVAELGKMSTIFLKFIERLS